MLRGYLFFRVNDKYFMTYTPAQKYRTTIETGELFFEGYHIWNKWQGFFYRMDNPVIKEESYDNLCGSR